MRVPATLETQACEAVFRTPTERVAAALAPSLRRVTEPGLLRMREALRSMHRDGSPSAVSRRHDGDGGG